MKSNPLSQSDASMFTDEEILGMIDFDLCEAYQGIVVPVLQDYVRLRKIENAIKAKVDAVNSMPSAPLDGAIENQKINGEKLCAKITAFEEIKRLLAEAEKGEVTK